MSLTTSTLATLVIHLGEVCRARAVAVWACVNDPPELASSWLLDQRFYNLMHENWPDMALELREGRSARIDDVLFVPLMSGHCDLLGVLEYVGGEPASGAMRAYFENAPRELAAVLADPPRPADPDALTLPLSHVEVPGGLEEAERRLYMSLLNRRGWNVSLVARLLGIARQTLYNRLRALGIDRPSPSPKGRRFERTSEGRLVHDGSGVPRGAATRRAAAARAQ